MESVSDELKGKTTVDYTNMSNDELENIIDIIIKDYLLVLDDDKAFGYDTSMLLKQLYDIYIQIKNVLDNRDNKKYTLVEKMKKLNKRFNGLSKETSNTENITK